MDEIVEKKVKKVKEKIEKKKNVYSTGQVIHVSSYIVEVSGLNDISLYEAVDIVGKASGYVFGIFFDKIIVAFTDVKEPIMIGDEVVALAHEFKALFSLDSIGKVVDIFGHDLITNKTFENLVNTSINNNPVPIDERSLIKRELLTGITGIDLLCPIGKGQRMLIIGDKKTGKTQIALDTIINQKDKNVICFYVALGKTKKEVKEIYFELNKRGASSYTTFFAAFSDDLPVNIYLTPYVVMGIAENLMMQGYDVLVVIDDLKNHANAYRDINLASKNIPGAFAYPSDIFYKQARLLESGAEHIDGGSITILPIVETKNGEITDYISSNIISICDGQIVLSAKNFEKGQKPALDYKLSTSRLNNDILSKEMRELGIKVKRNLLSYLEVQDVYGLSNTEDLTKDIKMKLNEGSKIIEALNQYKFSPKDVEEIKKAFNFLDDGGTK